MRADVCGDINDGGVEYGEEVEVADLGNKEDGAVCVRRILVFDATVLFTLASAIERTSKLLLIQGGGRRVWGGRHSDPKNLCRW